MTRPSLEAFYITIETTRKCDTILSRWLGILVHQCFADAFSIPYKVTSDVRSRSRSTTIGIEPDSHTMVSSHHGIWPRFRRMRSDLHLIRQVNDVAGGENAPRRVSV